MYAFFDDFRLPCLCTLLHVLSSSFILLDLRLCRYQEKKDTHINMPSVLHDAKNQLKIGQRRLWGGGYPSPKAGLPRGEYRNDAFRPKR